MNENEFLYHYTSVFSFNEIVNTRKIWLSDCRYLNDSLELNKAIELFLLNFEGKNKSHLKEAFDSHNFIQRHCIFSMSKSPTVLSQWRTYGDDGRGICIGLRSQCITNDNNKENSNEYLIECIYENHSKYLSSVAIKYKNEIDEIIKLRKKIKAINEFWIEIYTNPQLLHKLFCEFLKIKNPAFKEEQEVRLVKTIPASQVRTRVSNRLIIPYTEHEFPCVSDARDLSFIFGDIWLGPKCDKRNIDGILTLGMLLFGSSINKFDCGYI